MKLIMEGASLLSGHYEDEMNESTGNTERNYYISGTFSTPEVKNRNGRVYSRNIWEREISKYQKEITERTANTLGEWQHPPRSTVDPLKAVLRIVELKMDENGNVVGKAKILNNNTEATNSIKGLIKEGIKIGVSSRGVGKVSSTGVVEDFKLITYDAVDMPSDYNAMLDGVVEGVQMINGIAQDKEYQIDENGCVGEVCSMTAPVSESKDGETKVEKCPIEEKINEAVAASEKKIYDNIDTYLQEAFAKVADERQELIESISEFLNPTEKVEVIAEKKFSGEKEYIFKTRDDADAASNLLLNYSEEGWEIQGKLIFVTQEDVAAELDDIIKDGKLTISKIVESDETKSTDADLAKTLLEALNEKKEEVADDGAKKDEDEDDSQEGKCTECGKEVEDEDSKLCPACADKVEDEDKVEESDLMAKLKGKVFTK